MNAIQFIQSTLFELNRSYVIEVTPLTSEQFYFRPAEKANSIAFLLWHFSRVQDNTFHRLNSPDGRPTVWEREAWQTHFPNIAHETGAGFTADQVSAFHPDKQELVNYVEAIRLSVQEGLVGMTDDDLDRPISPNDPKVTVGRQIQSIIVGHGFFHLGEIRFLKGLQGMPFAR